MSNYTIEKHTHGVHNRLPNYEIPKDSAQDELNWVTVDGGVVLSLGKQIMGAEGTAGEIQNLWFGTKNDGTTVLYAKYGTTIGYWNGTALSPIITGLTASADYSFQNYTSKAGNFTYATGVDGLYKMHNSSLGSYINMYVGAGKNFKGHSLINKGRMVMWGTAEDPTGLDFSYIDLQGSNYVTVTAESIGTGNGVQTVFTGTLAFKGLDPLANGFNLKVTQGANVSYDNYNGLITGTNISIGTINYVTGAYSITFTTPPPNLQALTVDYKWENSNLQGITDFTKSTTRVAGEGLNVRQDEGGDAIQRVVVGADGAYYSAKKKSFYRCLLSDDDSEINNEIYRKDLGIEYYQAVISTGKGIFFMNTANEDKPELVKLDRNPLGDSLIPEILFPHFKFENYVYNKGVLETWGRYIVIICRTESSAVNNRLLLCDPEAKTVDITAYGMKCVAKDGGILYGGSPFSYTLWKLFQGYDDDDTVQSNFWRGRSDDLGRENLKKTRRLALMGFIDTNQKVEVYVGADDQEEALIGTILGTGDYVDKKNPAMVGGGEVGGEAVGGRLAQGVNPYYVELKLKSPKFENRTILLKAVGFGYASVQSTRDTDILTYEGRIPKQYRQKQNVSLGGGQTNLPNPEF